MIRDVHPVSEYRIRIFYPSEIPDPVVKKAPDPGYGSATLILIEHTVVWNINRNRYIGTN
jgi:hypothetical protein